MSWFAAEPSRACPGRLGITKTGEFSNGTFGEFTSGTHSRRALEAFEEGAWGRKYAAIGQIWRRQWEQIIPFFAFAPAVRKIIYTTNAIEALNAKLRRAVRARGHFPSDEAATKLIFLVLRQVARQWKMPPREWAEAKTQFAIMFGERFVRT